MSGCAAGSVVGGRRQPETVILHESGRRVTVRTGIKTTQENGRPRLIAIVGTSPSARRRGGAARIRGEVPLLVETARRVRDHRRPGEDNLLQRGYAAIFEMAPQDSSGSRCSSSWTKRAEGGPARTA